MSFDVLNPFSFKTVLIVNEGLGFFVFFRLSRCHLPIWRMLKGICCCCCLCSTCTGHQRRRCLLAFNYLWSEKLMGSELFNHILCTASRFMRGQIEYGVVLHAGGLTWKQRCPFTKIPSIMDEAKSGAASSRSLWSHLITGWCCVHGRWVNCTLWLWTNLQVNIILPSGGGIVKRHKASLK